MNNPDSEKCGEPTGTKGRATLLWLCFSFLFQGCGPSDVSEIGPNGFLGSHKVTVTPSCIIKQTKIEQPSNGKEAYSSTCGDIQVEIKDEELFVNSKAYGKLNKGDSIHIDHNNVLINSKPASEITP